MIPTIPLIDISPFLTDASRPARGGEGRGCRLRGYGLPARLGPRHPVLRWSTTCAAYRHAFFERPLEDKLRYRMPPDRYRGFIAFGNEALAYSLDEETPPDLKESFSIGPVDAPDDAYHRAATPANFFAPNMWPEALPEFRATWSAYYRDMEELATTLMRIFAMGLGMDEHYFDDKIDRHITNFSVLHYPPQPRRRGRASCAPARTPTTAA